MIPQKSITFTIAVGFSLVIMIGNAAICYKLISVTEYNKLWQMRVQKYILQLHFLIKVLADASLAYTYSTAKELPQAFNRMLYLTSMMNFVFNTLLSYISYKAYRTAPAPTKTLFVLAIVLFALDYAIYIALYKYYLYQIDISKKEVADANKEKKE